MATQINPGVQRFDPREASTANVVYVLYLVGLVIGITPIVGVIMAYVNRSDAPDWVLTHYRFQIRTFWIGLLYGVISLVTCLIIIGFIFLGLLLIWWIVRCVKGMQAISRGVPYERPGTWMW